MWIWLCYFIQHIHMCLCIFRWSWVIFLSLLKHINIGVFIHLPMFHWFIIIWRCRLIHKLGLYTSCNIPPSTSHRFWSWYFLRLTRYYNRPYFILIPTILKHKLRLRRILHFSLWKLSSWIVFSLKTFDPYILPYHFLW